MTSSKVPDAMRSLAGKVAIVTGASSGIGEATARALSRAGCSVALGARRKDRIDALRDELEQQGGTVLAAPTDVASFESVRAFAERTSRTLGPVDILVNNAGVMPLSPLRDARVEEWSRMVDVNVKGVLHGIAAVLPGMLERRSGHIVNVGSVAGRRPFVTGTVYAATKFAVRAISAGLHLELSATDGIRVTDIEPGVVDTELADQIADPESRQRFDARWEGRRKLAPGDVARTIVFAVSAPEHMNINEILVRPTDQPT